MAKNAQRMGWLFEVLQEAGDGHLVFDDTTEVSDVYALLLHRVAIAQGNCIVLQRLVIDSHTERRADSILTAVTLTNLILLLVLAVEVELEVVDNLTSLLWQTILLGEGEHS